MMFDLAFHIFTSAFSIKGRFLSKDGFYKVSVNVAEASIREMLLLEGYIYYITLKFIARKGLEAENRSLKMN